MGIQGFKLLPPKATMIYQSPFQPSGLMLMNNMVDPRDIFIKVLAILLQVSIQQTAATRGSHSSNNKPSQPAPQLPSCGTGLSYCKCSFPSTLPLQPHSSNSNNIVASCLSHSAKRSSGALSLFFPASANPNTIVYLNC